MKNYIRANNHENQANFPLQCPSSHVSGLSTRAIYFPSNKELKVSTNTAQRAWDFTSNNNRARWVSHFYPSSFTGSLKHKMSHPGEAQLLQAAVALQAAPVPLQRLLLFWVQTTGGQILSGNPETQDQKQVSLALSTLQPRSLLDLEALTPTRGLWHLFYIKYRISLQIIQFNTMNQ